MNICTLGQSIFKKDPARKKMFAFSVIIEEMSPKKTGNEIRLLLPKHNSFLTK